MDLQHFPVNWVEGMKISRRNLEHTDYFIYEQVQDVRSLYINDFSYGILSSDKPFDLSVFFDSTQLITIELRACKAVTPSGARIDVLPSQEPVRLRILYSDIISRFGLNKSSEHQFYIIVAVNPFQRVPVGKPELDEVPPRIPFCTPEVKLDIVPTEQLGSFFHGNSLLVGIINHRQGELSYNKEFIPPGTVIQCHPLMVQWYNKFRQMSETWEQSAIKILQKINSKTTQANSLTNTIQKLSDRILEKLVDQKTRIQWIIPKSSPIHLCEMLLQNVHFIHAMIITLPEKEREEVINYFAEWADMQAGNIENETIRGILIEYNHNNISGVFAEIMSVYNMYVQIFQKLSMLEFIGKKKGQNIFVIEQGVKEVKPNVSEKPGRWSPL